MNLIETHYSAPQAQLACDEYLLDQCDRGEIDDTLRLWHSKKYFAVLGYANQVKQEVHLDFCHGHAIPVLRRCSGGGSVLQGPGCFNFSLILRLSRSGPLKTIRETVRHILSQHQQALQPMLSGRIRVQGISDLTVGDLKFSGNSQRRKRNAVLFHGTFLLDMDLDLVAKVLKEPHRQPEYRGLRPHEAFITNLPLNQSLLRQRLIEHWRADTSLPPPSMGQLRPLIREQYSRDEWNLKF